MDYPLKEDGRPYHQSTNNNVITRSFSRHVPLDELKWHRDEKDRVIKVLSGTNWFYQMDNSMPIKMTVGMEFFIPKNSWHRVIAGVDDLTIQIIED